MRSHLLCCAGRWAVRRSFRAAVSFHSLWPLLCVLYNILIAFVFCYYAYHEVVRFSADDLLTVGTLAPVGLGRDPALLFRLSRMLLR